MHLNTVQLGGSVGGRQVQVHADGQPSQILSQEGLHGLVAFALEAGAAVVVFQTLVAAAVTGAPNKSKKNWSPEAVINNF